MSNAHANRRILVDTLIKLMRRNASANVKKITRKTHPEDLAYAFHKMKRDESAIFLDILFQSDQLGAVLLQLPAGESLEILDKLEDQEIAAVCRALPTDEAVDLLGLLPKPRVEDVLTEVETTGYKALRQLMVYDRHTAGGRMSHDYLAVHEDTTVHQTIDILQNFPRANEIFYIYILGAEEDLHGVLSLRQLLTVPADTPVGKIMKPSVIKVDDSMPQEDVARIVAKYDLLSVPVVDHANRLIGVITVDDIIDVIKEEQTDDLFKMAGTARQELLYGNQVFKISRVRLPWLLTNLGGGLLAAGILSLFKHPLEEVIALAFFVPVITAMGGNVGIQSSTITTRGLATGRIDRSQVTEVLSKELRVGLLMGLICGGMVGLAATLWRGNPMLGAVVGGAMFCAITVAALMGCITPIIFERFGIDPAISSGPFVTTSNDITGLIIYFTMASLLLQYLS